MKNPAAASEPQGVVDVCMACAQDSLTVLDVAEGLRYKLCTECGLCRKHIPYANVREDFQMGQASYYERADEDLFAEPPAIMRERMARRVAILRRYLNPGAMVLEIGPGGGLVAQWLRRQDCQYLGCEISQTLTHKLKAQGINAMQGEFERIDLPVLYDMVLSFHTIEHVPEPRVQLTRAFSVTRPGGRFIIATPNARSWEQRMLPRLSTNFDIGHLHVFSPESLRIMAEAAGWQVDTCITSEYTSDWLRIATKMLRRIKGEDEVTSAGKYSRSAASGHIALVIALISVFTRPFRGMQARMGGGNEIIMVLRKPGLS